jgi:hypothetical protein
MLARRLDQHVQVFVAILIVRNDVALVHPTLHDVHREAADKRSMLPGLAPRVPMPVA